MFVDVGSDDEDDGLASNGLFSFIYHELKNYVVAKFFHLEHIFEKADLLGHCFCYGILSYSGFHEAYMILAFLSFIALLLTFRGA